MAIQGKRLYWQAWAGSAIAFTKRGWDNGALGGVLQTKAFQEAMHVSQRPGPYVLLISSKLSRYRSLMSQPSQ